MTATVRMWAPNGVRVDSICLAGTTGQAGPVLRDGRMGDGAWLVLVAPSGQVLGRVDANGAAVATRTALAELAAGLESPFTFDPATLTTTPPANTVTACRRHHR
jgi:hypothetical protein